MEVYDELASWFSDEDCDSDEDDDLYKPPPDRRRRCQTEDGSQKSSHNDKENKNPLFSGFLEDGEDGKKVTVEKCKDYLRKHGLRLSGTKAVLIERIKGHLQGEEKSTKNELEVLDHSSDPIQDDIGEQFAKMDLNHANNVGITELLKDEKNLTVEDCKAYLREHGLRLAGTKQVLIDRIKEHLEIKDDQGLSKYLEATFTINCQGDACIGDVVLFKQRVYDFFNVGGRCSAGPPVGIRTIAGRIVKESYGSAKQQHTFTIEVLWSTGDRPLPPLYPLIIKGRNLYRVKTLRQAWGDEMARTKQLQEKHARGAAARKERRARIEGMKQAGVSKNRTCGTAAGKKSRDEKRANGSQVLVPVSKACGDVHARVDEHASRSRDSIHAETAGSIHVRKDIPFCSETNRIVNAYAHSMCRGNACIQGAKVNASMGSSTTVGANKNVDLVSMTNAHMMSSSVESLSRNNSSIHAPKTVAIVPATTSSYMVSDPVEHVVPSVELRFKRALAGLLIGTNRFHITEVKRVSQAEISVDDDAANPELCIVKITGTAPQKEVAMRMMTERATCKYFASKGLCSKGKACIFSHAPLGG